MKNDNEKSFKDYFRTQGYSYHKKDKILDYIGYEFLFYKKDREDIALYVLKESDGAIHTLIDACRTCSIEKQDLRICLGIPSTIPLPTNIRLKIDGTSIEVYSIEGGVVEPVLIASEIRVLKNKKIEEIKDTLKKMNATSKIKYGCRIFKIENKSFSNLTLNTPTQKDFVFQIQTINSILESLEFDQIKSCLNPTKKEEESFKKRQSISVLEMFFKKKNLHLNKRFQGTVKELRDLRDLRNMPPAHPSSNYKEVCKKYIGKQVPNTQPDWKKLNQICMAKFTESLKILRDCMLGK